MFDLSEKIIVVTGSNGLLGTAIANKLRDLNARVIGADIKFTNPSDDDFTIDITDEQSVNTAIKAIVDKYGRIDGWINNAYPRTADWGAKVEDLPFDSWRKNIDMHLNGYFNCARAALEQMKLQRAGSLINMSSIYGSNGPDFTIYEGTQMTMPVGYAAIKGGINTLTKYLAAYYGPYNIRVNCVSPGGVFDNQPASFVQRYTSRVPMKRMAKPSDIVGAICFLQTDSAAYITGQNIMVDGGWSCI